MIDYEDKPIVERYKNMISAYSHEDDKYKKGFFGEENISLLTSIKFLDTTLRMLIGKTDDVRIALCSHQAIINREFPTHFCRVCNKDLSIGNVGRYNDYLVLRHPQCLKPICIDCAKNKPDVFFIAFKKGLDKFQEFKQDERILLHFIKDLKDFSKQLNNINKKVLENEK